MDNTINSKGILRRYFKKKEHQVKATNLSQAAINRQYIIKEVKTDDNEIKDFLLTLGCYEGEAVTVISVLAENYIITVKDARYSIDKELAEVIII